MQSQWTSFLAQNVSPSDARTSYHEMMCAKLFWNDLRSVWLTSGWQVDPFGRFATKLSFVERSSGCRWWKSCAFFSVKLLKGCACSRVTFLAKNEKWRTFVCHSCWCMVFFSGVKNVLVQYSYVWFVVCMQFTVMRERICAGWLVSSSTVVRGRTRFSASLTDIQLVKKWMAQVMSDAWAPYFHTRIVWTQWPTDV